MAQATALILDSTFPAVCCGAASGPVLKVQQTMLAVSSVTYRPVRLKSTKQRKMPPS
jgi:hypothetical protein